MPGGARGVSPDRAWIVLGALPRVDRGEGAPADAARVEDFRQGAALLDALLRSRRNAPLDPDGLEGSIAALIDLGRSISDVELRRAAVRGFVLDLKDLLPAARMMPLGVRRAAARGLALSIEPADAEDLLQRLGEPAAREIEYELLGALRGAIAVLDPAGEQAKDVVATLFAALAEDDFDSRSSACAVLLSSDVAPALRAQPLDLRWRWLAKRIPAEPSPELRRELLALLGRTGGPEAAAALLADDAVLDLCVLDGAPFIEALGAAFLELAAEDASALLAASGTLLGVPLDPSGAGAEALLPARAALLRAALALDLAAFRANANVLAREDHLRALSAALAPEPRREGGARCPRGHRSLPDRVRPRRAARARARSRRRPAGGARGPRRPRARGDGGRGELAGDRPRGRGRRGAPGAARRARPRRFRSSGRHRARGRRPRRGCLVAARPRDGGGPLPRVHRPAGGGPRASRPADRPRARRRGRPLGPDRARLPRGPVPRACGPGPCARGARRRRPLRGARGRHGPGGGRAGQLRRRLVRERPRPRRRWGAPRAALWPSAAEDRLAVDAWLSGASSANRRSRVLDFGLRRLSLRPTHRGVEQSGARRAHNPEVAGSNPAPSQEKRLPSDLFFCPWARSVGMCGRFGLRARGGRTLRLARRAERLNGSRRSPVAARVGGTSGGIIDDRVARGREDLAGERSSRRGVGSAGLGPTVPVELVVLVHLNVMLTASVKLLVTAGLASRYQAWKFQVSPGSTWAEPIGVGMSRPAGRRDGRISPVRLKRPTAPPTQSRPWLPGTEKLYPRVCEGSPPAACPEEGQVVQGGRVGAEGRETRGLAGGVGRGGAEVARSHARTRRGRRWRRGRGQGCREITLVGDAVAVAVGAGSEHDVTCVGRPVAVAVREAEQLVPGDLVVGVRSREDVGVAIAVQVRGVHGPGALRGGRDHLLRSKEPPPRFSYQAILSSDQPRGRRRHRPCRCRRRTRDWRRSRR